LTAPPMADFTDPSPPPPYQQEEERGVFANILFGPRWCFFRRLGKSADRSLSFKSSHFNTSGIESTGSECVLFQMLALLIVQNFVLA
jgi:hypothetical protein